MTQTVTTLKATVTSTIEFSASMAARKLGKAHAEAGTPELQGIDLYNVVIPAVRRDISAYNQDILAFPKVTSDADIRAAAKLYGEVFYSEYKKAYARFAIITRENQIVTLEGVSRYKGKIKTTVTGVTITRIGTRERDGVTYGTCKIDGIARAVTLTKDNRWVTIG